MKSLIFTTTIIFSLFFFVIMSVVGYNYMGADDSPIYMYACVGLNFISIFFFLKDLFLRKFIVTKELIFIIGGQFLLLLSFFLENPIDEFARKQPLAIFALAMPTCYIAYDVAKTNSWKDMTKWLDILAILITFGVIINIPTIIISKGYGDIQGGQEALNINYQSAAYYSAFAYSITLTLLLFGDVVHNRFKIFKTKIFNIFSVALLVAQAALCLMSGGRGGAVLLFLSTVVFLIIAKPSKLRKLFLQISIATICIIVPATLIFPSFGEGILDVIVKSSERTFSYLSSDGIDMSQTSNRDLEYNAALTTIAKSPIIGHGFFRYIDVKNYSIYPHNFFLEILLQGGTILLIIVLIILFSLYRKYIKMVKYDQTNILLVPLICYPATLLMFSGSYLDTSLFWFGTMYIYCYKMRSNKKVKRSNSQ